MAGFRAKGTNGKEYRGRKWAKTINVNSSDPMLPPDFMLQFDIELHYPKATINNDESYHKQR